MGFTRQKACIHYPERSYFCYTKKWSFSLRFSSVNVTTSEASCGFGNFYGRNTLWKHFLHCLWKNVFCLTGKPFTLARMNFFDKKMVSIGQKTHIPLARKSLFYIKRVSSRLKKLFQLASLKLFYWIKISLDRKTDSTYHNKFVL